MPHRTEHLSPLDTRIPKWDKTTFTDRLCPFCQKEGIPRYIRPDTLCLRSCTTCHTYFIAPCPDARQLEIFYAHYNESHRPHTTPKKELIHAILSQKPTSDIRIAELLSYFPETNNKAVLDVGFGLGANLLYLKKLGFTVTGIEVDPDAIEFAQSYLGIEDVCKATIEELRDEEFDLILLHDLIEHPLHPLPLLRNAVQLLRPGGLLSIWTPNASNVSAQNDPVMFRVDLEHMQYLTVSTCAYLAPLLGVELIHLEGVGYPSIKNIERPKNFVSRTALLKRFLQSFPGFTMIQDIRRNRMAAGAMSKMRQGNYHLFCIYRKP